MRSLASVVRQYWWALELRGAAAILFGVIAFLWPGLTLQALLLLFAAYAFVDGTAAIILGITQYGERDRWWATLLSGIVSVMAGIVTVIMPGLTAVALLALIAVWLIIRGIFDVMAAIRLRHVIEGEWLLALSGVLSIAFGILLIARPGAGALALIYWIGAFAFASGIVLVALGLRLRSATASIHA